MDIGQLKFHSNDLDRELTIKEYLKELLYVVWDENECFSGKRPFGNSGWEWDIYKVLINHNIIGGKIDESGYIEECNDLQGREAILNYIKNDM